jgi:hypothetical protein
LPRLFQVGNRFCLSPWYIDQTHAHAVVEVGIILVPFVVDLAKGKQGFLVFFLSQEEFTIIEVNLYVLCQHQGG